MIFLSLLLIYFAQVDVNDKPPCIFSKPDTSVASILLEDSASSSRVIGSQYVLNDQDNLIYLSQDKKQILTLFFHGGDSPNQFSEFEVRNAKKSRTKKHLSIAVFRTNSGIELGISKIDVISKLGNCYVVSKTNNGHEILNYKISDMKDSEFLRRYNMPSYYAEYEFKKDTLLRFKFGFEYP
jgi:hypothetical protein